MTIPRDEIVRRWNGSLKIVKHQIAVSNNNANTVVTALTAFMLSVSTLIDDIIEDAP